MGRPSKFSTETWGRVDDLTSLGWSASQISEATGVGAGAIRQRRHRGNGTQLDAAAAGALRRLGRPKVYSSRQLASAVSARLAGAPMTETGVTPFVLRTEMARRGIDIPDSVRILDRQRAAAAAAATVRVAAGYPADLREYTEKLAAERGGELVEEVTGSGGMRWIWKCSRGHTFEMLRTNVLNGHWCPTCSHVGPSKAQLEVADFVRSLGFEVEVSTRKVISPMEIDIWAPAKKLAIEYNGLYHHSEVFGRQRGRHHGKWKALDAQNISLLAFFSDEWKSKRTLLEGMIRQRLGVAAGAKADARKCEVREVDSKVLTPFFEAYHLDGSGGRNRGFGLYLGDVLVAAMSFRKNMQKEQEIARFAINNVYVVRGAAGRLIAAYRSSNSGPLYTYSNNRLSRGGVYQTLGFRHVASNGPSYWYTDGLDTRVWRLKCKKINDPEVVAKFPDEAAQAAGGVFSQKIFGDDRPMWRIEDYGHQKWVLD